MHATLSTAKGLFTISALILACASGCSEKTTKPGPPPPESGLDRSTRMGLIHLLAEAHEDRDLPEYSDCLHPDFVFEFSQDDVGCPEWDWTASIGKAEDSTVTARMFSAEAVVDVSLSLFNMTEVEGAETDEDRFLVKDEAAGQDTVHLHWAQFAVDMHGIEETEEDTRDHWVDGRARIYLCPDPNDEALWSIWKIEDLGTMHLKATEDCSWSEIKACFRK